MPTINLSLINRLSFSDVSATIEQFKTQNHIDFHIDYLTWDKAWSTVMKTGIYGVGSHISQIGTTWADSLLSLNALSPFTPAEVRSLGGYDDFIEAAWQEKTRRQAYSIPFISDTRVLYYRRDWLAKAGIDENEAFSSLENFENTIQTLHDAGVTIPLAMSTSITNHTIEKFQDLASWVWEAGGQFTNEKGKVTFNRPEAVTGAVRYFTFQKNLSKEGQNLPDPVACSLFRNGKAAILLSGSYHLHLIKRGIDTIQEVQENIGVAKVPSTPFVGGSNLVVWKHCRDKTTALHLIRFLTSHEFQLKFHNSPLLPVRNSILNHPLFADDPHYKVICDSLENGRSLKALYNWGIIEEKLAVTLGEISAEIFSNPNVNLEALVTQEFNKLAEQLNSM